MSITCVPRSAPVAPACNTDSNDAEHPSLTTRRFALTRVALLRALAVGLLVRLHCLRFTYLFLDEFVTLWSIGGENYAEMLSRARRWTASGPLFVLCYRLSCDLAGDRVWGLKVPGILAGVL